MQRRRKEDWSDGVPGTQPSLLENRCCFPQQRCRQTITAYRKMARHVGEVMEVVSWLWSHQELLSLTEKTVNFLWESPPIDVYKIPSVVLNVEYLIFWCGATMSLGGTYQSGAKHITEDLVHDVVLWCTFVSHNIAGAIGSYFSELHAKWRYQLRAHPTQLRVTRHRVGCDDTQKKVGMAPRPVFLGFGMLS
jgi:hypothetical protein